MKVLLFDDKNLESDETRGEKIKWKLLKNDASCSENMLEAKP